MRTMGRSFAAFVAVLSLSLVACPKREQAQGGAGDTGAPDASVGEAVEPDEEVRPVYPADAGPPDPTTTRLCQVLHDLPEQKRAACCETKPAVVFTSECERVVTAALHFKAISLDAPAIDACRAALEGSLAGCDWPGPFPPAIPPACEHVVKGALAAGARCRSSLECAGDLRCHGVGPTRMGRCGGPKDDGEACGGTADPLASYTRADDLDTAHPECRGWCNRTKCAAKIASGGACTLSAGCDKGLLCVSPPSDGGFAKTGKCSPASPAKAGQPCPGGACEEAAVCLQGKCVARKHAGASCATDFECIGGCLKDAGSATGTCGKKCSVR